MRTSILSTLCGVLLVTGLLWGCKNGETTQPKTDTVIISGMKFNPEVLTVNKGDTVLWINQGIVVHNVTAYPDKKWTSDSIETGQSWSKIITDSLSYFCSFHPNMIGKIEIRITP